jgi:pyridoxal 5'-phosphate synthase pdxT subunit
MRRVGVLALQGDYAAHRAALAEAGAESFDVRTAADIDSVEAIVLPGGESTVMGSLLLRFGLLDRLVERIRGGLPVFGTCAGLILLAARIDGREQPGIRLLDVSVARNAYGRQVASFRARVTTSLPGVDSIEAVFIRAPRITSCGPGVRVLAEHGGDPILVRQDSIVGCAFHPELVPGALIHRWFLTLLAGHQ